MRTAPLRSSVFLLALTVTPMTSGCELAVQLDRSLADSGPDLCNICSDAGADDAGADADPDAPAPDDASDDGAPSGSADATVADAETSG